MKATTKLILIVGVALAMSVPALAQQPNWSQSGDYYRPGNTAVQQPTPHQRYVFRHGDYYTRRGTMVQRPTPRQLYLYEHGDYYAPGRW
jgi:hypothetical protein